MQKILLLGPTYRFPTISPEILLTFLGAGPITLEGWGMCVLAQDCLQLKEKTEPSSSSAPFCPDFTLSTPALCSRLCTHKRKIKTNHYFTLIAGGMGRAVIGTVVKPAWPAPICPVCVHLPSGTTRTPRCSPSSRWSNSISALRWTLVYELWPAAPAPFASAPGGGRRCGMKFGLSCSQSSGVWGQL